MIVETAINIPIAMLKALMAFWLLSNWRAVIPIAVHKSTAGTKASMKVSAMTSVSTTTSPPWLVKIEKGITTLEEVVKETAAQN